MSLPQGYKELQYLTAETAGPYIQLNNGFDATDEVEIKTKIDNLVLDKYLVAPLSWNQDNNRFAMGGQNSKRGVGFGALTTNLTLYSPKVTQEVGQIATETYANRLFTITGENINSTCNVSNISFGVATTNLRLFFGYNSATEGSIYYWKHKKVVDGVLTLVEDLVPAERTSDHVLGMYDKVSGNFFTNPGSGTFTAGPYAETIYTIKKSFYKQPPKLPSEYTELEYIQSSGTQYIDTGLNLSANDIVSIKYALLNGTASYGTIFGSQSGSAEAILRRNNDTLNIQLWRLSYTEDSPDKPTDVVWDRVVESKLKAELGSAYSIYLFASNRTDSPVYHSKSKIYHYGVYRNSECLRNLIPVKRNSDSEIGMYDTVTNTFFTNQGTGTFIAGPSLNIPEQYQELDYIQSSGTQYINTGFVLTASNNKFRLKSALHYGNVTNYPVTMGCSNVDDAKNLFVRATSSDYTSTTFKYNALAAGQYLYSSIGIQSNWDAVNDLQYDQANKKFILNGTTYSLGSSGTFTTSNSVYLFGMHLNRGLFRPSYSSIYSCYLENGDGVKRSFVPACRKSDNVLGMYDKCNSGKNLFDKSAITSGKYLDSNGQEISYDVWNISDYIAIKGGETYYQRLRLAGNAPRTCWYDNNKTFISSTPQVAGGTIVAPANACYCRMCVIEGGGGDPLIYDLDYAMLVKGSTAPATYEPYPFYTNAGTGSFIAGNPVYNDIEVKKSYFVKSALPDGYKKLEYITTVNAYQALDSEYIPNSDDNFEYKGIKKSGFSIFGVASGVTYNFTGSGSTHQFRVGTNNNVVTMDATLHTVKVVDANVYVDGVKTADTIIRLTPAVSMTYSVSLFGRNRGTTVDDGGAGQTLYYIKFFDKLGTLKFYAIPCINPNGVIGMYDLVAGKFLNRIGTDTTTPFTAGPEVTNYNIYTIKQSHYFIGG